MSLPEVSLIVSTFQRPYHLERSLLSIAVQQGVDGKIEVVVTDDGSADATWRVVSRFAASVEFPVSFTTHRHEGFRLARCRNEGVLASTARYLIFLDGDLLIPPDFVALHLAHRRPGAAVVGDSCWLDEKASQRIAEAEIRSASYLRWVSPAEQKRLRWKAFRAGIYCRLRLANRPRLKGGNVALWRDDFERINGYDQDYVGWGLEDSDFQWRLSLAGVRFLSSMSWTRTYHLCHPRDPSYVPRARGTKNESLLLEHDRPPRCRNGLRQHGKSRVTRLNDNRQLCPRRAA